MRIGPGKDGEPRTTGTAPLPDPPEVYSPTNVTSPIPKDYAALSAEIN